MSVAASIEHAILLQYMFTAWTLKKRGQEGLTPKLEITLRRWEESLLRVAHEEMIHLGTVTHLLSAVGAAPVLHRANFPQAISPGSPFALSLTKWDDHTMWRYVRMELPDGEPVPPEPADPGRARPEAQALSEPIEFDYLGELYRIIRAGFTTLGERALLIPEGVDKDTEWTLDVRTIPAIVDLPSALSALDVVVEQGEGSPANRADSHYETFRRLRAELAELPKGFVPTRNVVDNPRTWQDHRDSPLPGTYIENATTRRVAGVANDAYRVLILLLQHLFSYDTPADAGLPTLGDHNLVKACCGHLMSGFIRPIAEILTELPVGDDRADGVAGIPFEVYEEIRLPARHEPRFTFITEILATLAADCQAAAAETGLTRLRTLADHARWTRRNLTDGIPRGI